MEDETITREQILKELNFLREENARLKGERLSWGKTKQALADSQQKLDLAIKGSNGGLWQIFMDPGDAKNPVSDRIYLSPQCKALLGYEDDELPNSLTAWARLIPPEDRPLLQERAMATLADGADMFADEYRIRHKDGSVRWHRLHGRLQRDVFGAPLNWSGMVWDVTMRKQAEIALRESEEKYRAAFELAPVGVGHVTAEGTYLLANQRLCEILGYSSAELRRMTTHDVTHPDDVEEGRGLMDKIGAGIISRYAREKRYLRKNGSIVWVYITVSTVQDAAGRPKYFITVAQDISERKRAEEALKESEERYRATFELAPLGVSHQSPDGRYLLVNQRLCEILGYTAEELRGLTVYDVSHPQDGKKTRQRVKRALAGDLPRYHREKRYLRKDGSIVWASVTVSLVQDSQGRPKYFIVLVEDISERKKAEQALRESEERFRDLARFLPETIFEMDPRGRLTFVNEQALTRFGYTRRDFAQGLNGLDMIASNDRERARQNMMEVMTGKDLGLNEYAAQKKGGGTFPVLMHSTPIIKDGQAAGLRGFIIDISEREKVARELRESEELYRATFELAPVGVSHLSPEGKYLQANQRFCQLLGYTREELAELTFSDLTHPEDAPGSVKRVQQALEGRPPKYPREKRYLRKDGSVLWASVTSSLVRDSAGRPKYFIALAEDITEWKKAQEALRKSEERYRFITEKATDVIWQMDLEGNFQFLSPAFERLTGWSIGEGLSLNLKDIIAPDSHGLVADSLAKKIAATGALPDVYTPPLILPLKALRKDGTSFMAEVSVKLLRDSAGRPIGLTGVTRDVTERIRTEEALKKLAENLEKRVQELNCLYSVSNFLGETDKPPEETLAAITRLLPTAFLDPKKICARIKLDEKTFTTDHFQETPTKLASDITTATGLPIGVMEIFLQEDAPGAGGRSFLQEEVTLIDAVAHRISDWLEKKRTEAEKQTVEIQLRQAQKIEALGTLAGGIAHDFNNILAVIMGHTELALEKAKAGEDGTREMNQVFKAAVRASNLVKQILTFSRKVETEFRPLNLNQEIARSVKLLERTIPKMISIESHLADDLALIKGDPNQMEQVLLNLATNAIDAMPQGGRLVIQTQNVSLDHEFCVGHIDLSPGTYVLWQISDTGTGIDEETQKHIFDPFFTTKEVGKGTGLGLSMVYGIVRSHGGYISCYSHKDELGTTFKVYLPVLTGGEAPITFESEASQAEAGGQETVLVVDDEKAIRDSTTEILKRRGYKTFTASSGEEALEIYRERQDQIDLIVLDVGMPGMGGLKCFGELSKINPRVKVLIASGYSVEGQLKQTAAGEAAGFIGKPYRLRDMLSKVREILGQND